MQARRKGGRGQPSDIAMPPRVVASNRGIRRGLAISSQGGRAILAREGTTCSRVRDWALAMDQLRPTTDNKGRQQSDQQSGPQLMGDGDGGHREAQAKTEHPQGDLQQHHQG